MSFNGEAYAYRLQQARDYLLAGWRPAVPEMVLVLGSGFNDLVSLLPIQPVCQWDYRQIPDFPPAHNIAGHKLRLISAAVKTLSGYEYQLAIMQGRLHCYQGYSPHDAVFLLRALLLAGAKTVLLCSAVGSVSASCSPGQLVPISDQLNLTGINPLIGWQQHNGAKFGPQFPDQTAVYYPALVDYLRPICQHFSPVTYGLMIGPSFETPAEKNALRLLGAQVVGMTMPIEATAANQLGARVGGLGLVTNVAAANSSHEEVLAAAQSCEAQLQMLLTRILTELPQQFIG